MNRVTALSSTAADMVTRVSTDALVPTSEDSVISGGRMTRVVSPGSKTLSSKVLTPTGCPWHTGAGQKMVSGRVVVASLSLLLSTTVSSPSSRARR